MKKNKFIKHIIISHLIITLIAFTVLYIAFSLKNNSFNMNIWRELYRETFPMTALVYLIFINFITAILNN